MPAATRLNDNCTGHDACPPVPLAEGSPNVFTNGRPAGRRGDHYASHGVVKVLTCFDVPDREFPPAGHPWSTDPGHQDVIAAGSSTVFINGRPAARKGDAVSIGGAVQDGSGNVFIGG